MSLAGLKAGKTMKKINRAGKLMKKHESSGNWHSTKRAASLLDGRIAQLEKLKGMK